MEDHLGNVRATLSDYKTLAKPQIVNSATDYYPFGMVAREYASSEQYRFGYGTQEKDVELGEGIYTAEYWEYDSRLGRRWNLDPVLNHKISLYSTFYNNPIAFNDPKGNVVPILVWAAAITIEELIAAGIFTYGAYVAWNHPIEFTGGKTHEELLTKPKTTTTPKPQTVLNPGETPKPIGHPFPVTSPSESQDIDTEVDGPEGKAKKFWITYTKTSEDGSKVYSGRSSGYYTGLAPTPQEIELALKTREAGHKILRGEKYQIAKLDKVAYGSPEAYYAIRGREQELIDYYGGAQSDRGASGVGAAGTSRNKIRGYSRANVNGFAYKMAAAAKGWLLPTNHPADKPKPAT